MIYNIFPSLIFIIIIVVQVKTSKRVVSLYLFIHLLYFFSMVAFLICSIYDTTYYYSIKALLLVLVSLMFSLQPLKIVERHISSESKLKSINISKYNSIVKLLIIFGLYSVVFFIRNLVAVFSSDLSVVRYFIENGGSFYTSSLYSKTAVLGAYLFPISMYFYFYSKIKDYDKFITKTLLISSSSFIFYTLNVAGRDGIVIWIFTYLAQMSFFYPMLPKKKKKIEKYSLIVFSIVLVVVFIFITTKRFGNNSNAMSSVLMSMFEYFGQQLFQLSFRLDKIYLLNYPGEPRLILSLPMAVKDFFFQSDVRNNILNRYELRQLSLNLGLNTQKFSYYIGSIYTELKLFGVLILNLIIYFIGYTNFKIRGNAIDCRKLIIPFTWYMILIVGVFYFYYGQLIGNVFLIIPFLLSLYFRIKLPIFKIGLSKYLIKKSIIKKVVCE